MSRLVVWAASTRLIFRLISTSIAYLCLLFIYRFLENIGAVKKRALKSRRSGNKMWLKCLHIHITNKQGSRDTGNYWALPPVPIDIIMKPANICKH